MNRVASIFCALAVILLMIVLRPAPAHPGAAAGELSGKSTIAPMLEKVLPIVVTINVKGLAPVEQSLTPFHSQPTAPPAMRPFKSSGSGVIVDAARGLIITNYHVVEKAIEIKVVTHDAREFVGRLIGRDAATDVATVQIEAADLIGAVIADSRTARAGDFVVAIGSPFGLDGTATMGMISTLQRSGVGYRNFESYIQHDAAVNTGNSGGALINMQGELIGINTAILSPTSGNVGLGFAIPVRLAIHVMEQLVKHGMVQRGSVGFRLEDMKLELMTKPGLRVRQGALIKSVRTASPAESAGLQAGDVVTAVDQTDVRRASDFYIHEAFMGVGHDIVVYYDRQGVKLRAQLKIADLKPEQERLTVPDTVVRLAGMVIGTVTSDTPFFGELLGAEIVEVKKGTLANIVGLLPGDIITAIDQAKVRKPEDVIELTKDRTAGFDIHFVRNGVPLIGRIPI